MLNLGNQPGNGEALLCRSTTQGRGDDDDGVEAGLEGDRRFVRSCCAAGDDILTSLKKRKPLRDTDKKLKTLIF